MTTGTKRCTRCTVVRPLTDFEADRNAADGRRSRCMPCRSGLPDEIRDCRGLSPAERAALDAGAKAVAFRFVTAVKARDAAEVQRITAPMSREALIALALVAAEAADGMRLRAVTGVVDDGLPDGVTLAAPGRSRVPAGDAPPAGLRAVQDDQEAESDAA